MFLEEEQEAKAIQLPTHHLISGEIGMGQYQSIDSLIPI